RDRYIPPRFVSRHSHFECRLNHNYRSARLLACFSQRGLELLTRSHLFRPRSKAGGVCCEVERQDLAFVFPVFTIPVLRSHPIIAATPAEPADAGEPVIVQQNDVELVAL